MPEESAPGRPVTWRRVSGWVHRLVDDEVLLAGPGRDSKSLGGMATAVWLVLDRPASGVEIPELIARRWPDRPVDPVMATETVAVLESAGLIEPI